MLLTDLLLLLPVAWLHRVWNLLRVSDGVHHGFLGLCPCEAWA